MRAISLWQPWASAIALGIKTIETRKLPTNYRGPLAIHAARYWPRQNRDFADAEYEAGRLPRIVHFGAIVATCSLVDCMDTWRARQRISDIEEIYGDYSSGRYAWYLDDIRALANPIPWPCRQYFFSIPDEVVSL